MPAFTAESEAWLVKASERVRAIAREYNNSPTPVRLVELEDLSELRLCDGVHLTPVGYVEMARRIGQVLLGAVGEERDEKLIEKLEKAGIEVETVPPQPSMVLEGRVLDVPPKPLRSKKRKATRTVEITEPDRRGKSE